jgi:hypothetical protein
VAGAATGHPVSDAERDLRLRTAPIFFAKVECILGLHFNVRVAHESIDTTQSQLLIKGEDVDRRHIT